jgi:diguanylate cyclase (GGDEF)-like protein
MATHDPLTQLANRTLLEEHLKRALPQARRSGHQVALVLLDIDGFKALNDTLGHELGDEVLVQVGRRLSAGTRRGDLVARLGGDEFVVVLHGIDGECAPARVAEKILRRFSEPFLLAGTEYWIGGSIGISVFPSDGERVDELMRNADIALHQARLKGRGQYRFHAESMNARARKRLVVENGLRRALQRDGLRLVYQPRVSVATGEVAGAEALLRWRDPDLGDVPPSEFVPVAEQSGLIAPIGDWVLETAARQLSEWKRAGHQGLRMAVNVSAHQLALDDLHERVAQVVGDAELEPRELILEVTESCLLHDPENVARRLGALARMGFGIVLDDFGAGFSSLTLLRRFPIEGLKIDRLLVKDLPFDSDAAAIVGAILGIARQLDLSAVAEGVETEEQRSFLLGHGCDEIQGFLVSPGLLPEGFLKLLGRAGKSSVVPA